MRKLSKWWQWHGIEMFREHGSVPVANNIQESGTISIWSSSSGTSQESVQPHFSTAFPTVHCSKLHLRSMPLSYHLLQKIPPAPSCTCSKSFCHSVFTAISIDSITTHFTSLSSPILNTLNQCRRMVGPPSFWTPWSKYSRIGGLPPGSLDPLSLFADCCGRTVWAIVST